MKYSSISSTFEMEMDSKIFKQSDTDQAKGNISNLEYSNHGKNISGFLLSFKNF